MSSHTAATRIFAPSFNGRTADSDSAYRGSNPWGATKTPKLGLPLTCPEHPRKRGCCCLTMTSERLTCQSVRSCPTMADLSLGNSFGARSTKVLGNEYSGFGGSSWHSQSKRSKTRCQRPRTTRCSTEVASVCSSADGYKLWLRR
jgi:hypothetical protein